MARIRYDGHEYTIRDTPGYLIREKVKERLADPARHGQWLAALDGETEVELFISEGVPIAILG
jgi:hypothetical protein